jgi:hypothetical protein
MLVLVGRKVLCMLHTIKGTKHKAVLLDICPITSKISIRPTNHVNGEHNNRTLISANGFPILLTPNSRIVVDELTCPKLEYKNNQFKLDL